MKKRQMILSLMAGVLMTAMLAGAAAADEQTDLLLDATTVVTVLDPATTPGLPQGGGDAG